MTGRKPIRVTMVIQSYLPLVGGAEKQIESLSPFLREHNVEVHIITRRYAGLSSYEVMDGTYIHRVPIVGPKAVAAVMYIFFSLLKIKKLKPNLIHAHELLSPTTIAIFAKWLFGLPILAKVLRSGQIGDLAKVKASKFSKQRINLLTRNIDAFAVISQEIDEELASIGVEKQKRYFLPNGVDVERFKPVDESQKNALRKRLNLPLGTMMIYSGRLQPEKRVDQLIEVWNQIQINHKETFLVIVGKGIEENRLRKMAGAAVIFVGEVEDVVPYLNAADIYILPSATEGLSNSLLEAMACGLPVIATQVGGAPDLIKHEVRGLLISPDAPNELTQSIQVMLGDQSTRLEYSTKAREYVVEYYALPAMAERMRNLYDTLLKSRTPFL